MTVPATTLPPKGVPTRYAGLADAEAFGRLASRPDRIDPHAEAFYREWIAEAAAIDPAGHVILRPELVPIGSRPVPATSLGVPGAKIEKLLGDGQKGVVGELVGPVRIRVVDGSGKTAPGVAAVFTAGGLGATVGGCRAVGRITDRRGEVEIDDWRLGIIAGPQHLEVAVAGATATFKATAT